MHVIIIHAAYMSSVNSRYTLRELYKVYNFIDLYIEYTQRSQDCDPTLHHSRGSNLSLSTNKFNKWLRDALFIDKPSTKDQNSVWDYTSLISHRWIHLKT